MFRTFIIGAAVTVSATIAFAPTDANAQRYRDGYSRYDGYRDGYRGNRDGRRYEGRRYRGRDYRPYRSRYYRPRTRVNVYYGYPGYYGSSYGYGYPGYGGYYGGGYGSYYGGGYYPSRSRYRYRCGDGTTGAIVGGAAGALLGREIGRDGRRGYRRGRGSGTTGAIVGGAIGALVGREADRGC